eukprot:GHVP01062611.1.p1 GENE.GHVP01062611.1~~GHVP01062611.1.p1  ORF type:complete len:101 (-),score=14.35 GHVP01062611.1:51-353(-)
MMQKFRPYKRSGKRSKMANAELRKESLKEERRGPPEKVSVFSGALKSTKRFPPFVGIRRVAAFLTFLGKTQKQHYKNQLRSMNEVVFFSKICGSCESATE